jgi:hypothetical protein
VLTENEASFTAAVGKGYKATDNKRTSESRVVTMMYTITKNLPKAALSWLTVPCAISLTRRCGRATTTREGNVFPESLLNVTSLESATFEVGGFPSSSVRSTKGAFTATFQSILTLSAAELENLIRGFANIFHHSQR